MANLVALLALASLGGAASGNAGRREDDEPNNDDDRGSGDVSDVSVKYYKTDIDGKDALRMPRISIVDRVMLRAPSMFAHRSPLMSRVLTDGTYLRSGFGALWLALPLFGIVLGFMSAQNTDYAVRMPSLMLLTAVVVLGTLDAFSGYLASVVFALSVLVGGGMDSADSIRGVVGIWVFSFGVPLLATATRPFRRTASGVVGVWERCADVVLIALFGAWAAGAMFSSLPGLIGIQAGLCESCFAHTNCCACSACFSIHTGKCCCSACAIAPKRVFFGLVTRCIQDSNNYFITVANRCVCVRCFCVHRKQLGALGWWRDLSHSKIGG
ncbi:MAG: hypothetical protein EBQ60_00535, partial [Actinobacteria bacterium]|nr:hypothetical protein [Actinomycetota bacterium]